MLRTICCTFPFMVCACWFVTFALHWRTNDSAKRVLTIFLATGTVLYLCHAFYFNAEGNLPIWAESLWALCSLSVYPLYYIYISHLTCHPLSIRSTALWLLPGVLVAFAILVFPGTNSDNARKLLNAIQIFTILYCGFKRLRAFDRELTNVYADTEGRDTSNVRALLIAFVVTSLMSAFANAVGKQYVVNSDWLIAAILFPFTILLYSLSFIGYTRNFTLEQYLIDTEDTNSLHDNADREEDNFNKLGRQIEELMDGNNQYYLEKNLKITDLARHTGSCRTYVSNYINKTYNCSFSDYINRLRIQHAKRLLLSAQDAKMSVIADMSGFANEQSFYRNFKKFEGMTPSEWLTSQQR